MDSNVMTVICVMLCVGVTYKSRDNMNKGTIDSGAQTVVTIGVLFTFIGIAWSLLHFDTTVTNMVNSINDFISFASISVIFFREKEYSLFPKALSSKAETKSR